MKLKTPHYHKRKKKKKKIDEDIKKLVLARLETMSDDLVVSIG